MCSFCFSQPGTLDGDFDADGMVVTEFETYSAFATCVAAQPDGKIVVAGSVTLSNRDIAVVRYNTDGSLDNTFGEGGKVTTDIRTFDDWAFCVSIQNDGKIVVAGTTAGADAKDDVVVVRYKTNGDLDSTFSEDGIALDTMPEAYTGKGMALQSNGKIVLTGLL